MLISRAVCVLLLLVLVGVHSDNSSVTDPTDTYADIIEVIRKEVSQTDSFGTETSQSRRYCGTALIRALQIVCSDQMSKTKNLIDVNQSVDKWKAVYRQKRFKRGVVSECCLKTCDLNFLRNYCQPRV